MIANACNVTLDRSPMGLPQVRGVMAGFTRKMTFGIVKKRQDNFETIEAVTQVTVDASWQPFSAQRLLLKPEGQRKWKWFMIHATPALQLEPDALITYQGTRYRVMEKFDYSANGYVQYDVVDAYTHGTP